MKTAPNAAANLLGAAKMDFFFSFNIFAVDFEKRAKGENDRPKALIIKSKTKSKSKNGHLKNRDTVVITITENAVNLTIFSSV